MRHDWIIDLLNDLRAYALKNRLPMLAEGTEDLLAVALAEIAARRAHDDEANGGANGGASGGQNGGQNGPGGPPRGMPH